MFVAHITLSHVFKKNYKNVTEQLTSNTVSAQIFLTLWTLNPGAASSCHAVSVFENITFFSLFTNRLRPFHDFNHHTVTSNNHLFLFSSEIWDAALNSLSLSVLVMICVSFSDSFKCFHTADIFAALAHTSVWSCHIIVRYILFGLFANNFGCRKFSASQVFCS